MRAGDLEQIAPGFYVRPGAVDDSTAVWASISLRKPSATICMMSALAIHDLTDEIPSATDIALPRGERTVVTTYAPIQWHSFDRATFEVARTQLDLIGTDTAIGLYSPERTIVDAFRLRHDLGPEVAVEALKRRLRRRGSQPADVLAVARSFPQAYPALLSTLQILL